MSDEKQLMLLKTAKVLKPRESKFVGKFIELGGKRGAVKEAYQFISPGVKDSTAEVNGSKMMKRIMAKLEDPDYLDEWGLGKPRVLAKLDQLLEAENTQIVKYKTGQYSEGVKEVTSPDNATQMKAVTLAAEINRMKGADNKNEINVGVVVLKPDVIEKREIKDVN